MDSPKCLSCVDLTSEQPFAQTYKVAGKPQFKCRRCKKIFDKKSFSDAEFEWKSNRGRWDVFISDFVTDKIQKENLDNSLRDKALKIEFDKLDAIEKASKKTVKISEIAKEVPDNKVESGEGI